MRKIYLKPEHEERLLSQIERQRDRVIVKLMLATGMRVSEVAKLRVEDIDFSAREIFIWQGKGGKDRIVFVDYDTLKELRNYIGLRQEGPLFLSRQGYPKKAVTSRHIELIIRRKSRAAGLKGISSHKLRHTFAIRWVQKGGDIESLRRLLGHANLKATQVYLDFDNDYVKAEYDRLSGFKPQRPQRLEGAEYIS